MHSVVVKPEKMTSHSELYFPGLQFFCTQFSPKLGRELSTKTEGKFVNLMHRLIQVLNVPDIQRHVFLQFRSCGISATVGLIADEVWHQTLKHHSQMRLRTVWSIYFFLQKKKMVWHSMWIICIANDSHEMSSIICSEKIRNKN